MDIIRLEPVFKQTIWGGNKLKDVFHYPIGFDNVGECWGISAHPNGDCIVINTEYNGMKLSDLYCSHKELFGNLDYEKFPLLTKIIDAKENLSIQVHPDDEYAYVHENKSMGKIECWYILNADNDSKIIIGQNAKTKFELKSMIHNKKWNELVREVPVKKGDFFMIEPGTLHAIKGGTLLIETQENSDITYRVYDYDRQENGKLRPLNIEKSIDVIKTPYVSSIPKKDYSITINKNMHQYATCDSFTIWKLDVKDNTTIIQDQPCMLFSIIEGDGIINNEPVNKGDHFILPNGYGKVDIKGNFEAIISSPKQKVLTRRK